MSSITLATLKTNNFNKPEMLPLTAYLVLLKNFLTQTTINRFLKIRPMLDGELWQKQPCLQSFCLTSEETVKPQTSCCRRTPPGQIGIASANKEIVDSLQPMERKLLDRLDMVQTQSKQNKRGPVLFNPDMIGWTWCRLKASRTRECQYYSTLT